MVLGWGRGREGPLENPVTTKSPCARLDSDTSTHTSPDSSHIPPPYARVQAEKPCWKKPNIKVKMEKIESY